MNAAPRPLVLALGELLRAVPVPNRRVRLEVVTPNGRKTWRTVREGSTKAHAKVWARKRGIRL